MGIDKELLLDNIRQLAPMVKKSDDALQQSLLHFNNGFMYMANDYMCAKAYSPIPETFAVSPSSCTKALKSFNKDTVDYVVKDNELIFTQGRKKVSIAIEASSVQLDNYKFVETNNDFDDSLVDPIVLASVATEKSLNPQSSYNVINLTDDAVSATNGFAIMVVKKQTSMNTSISFEVVRKLISADFTKYGKSGEWLTFSNDNITLTVFQFHTDTKDLSKMIPDTFTNPVNVPENFIRAIQTAKMFSQGNDGNVVSIEAHDNVITVSSKNNEGAFSDTFSADTADFMIRLNPKYFDTLPIVPCIVDVHDNVIYLSFDSGNVRYGVSLYG